MHKSTQFSKSSVAKGGGGKEDVFCKGGECIDHELYNSTSLALPFASKEEKKAEFIKRMNDEYGYPWFLRCDYDKLNDEEKEICRECDDEDIRFHKAREKEQFEKWTIRQKELESEDERLEREFDEREEMCEIERENRCNKCNRK